MADRPGRKIFVLLTVFLLLLGGLTACTQKAELNLTEQSNSNYQARCTFRHQKADQVQKGRCQLSLNQNAFLVEIFGPLSLRLFSLYQDEQQIVWLDYLHSTYKKEPNTKDFWQKNALFPLGQEDVRKVLLYEDRKQPKEWRLVSSKPYKLVWVSQATDLEYSVEIENFWDEAKKKWPKRFTIFLPEQESLALEIVDLETPPELPLHPPYQP